MQKKRIGEMKLCYTRGGIAMPVSNEEHDFLLTLERNEGLHDSQMDERQYTLAHNLTSRGIVRRKKDGKDFRYTYNKMGDIWRF